MDLNQNHTFQNRRSFLKKITLLGLSLSFTRSFGMFHNNFFSFESFKIIISKTAKSYEEAAALLLQNLVYETFKIKLDINKDNTTKKLYEIAVGKTNRYPVTDLAKDEFIINSKSQQYLINGGSRGLFFGVVEFLNQISTINFDPTTNRILNENKNSINNIPTNKFINLNEKPNFNYRFIYYSQGFDMQYQIFNKLSTFGIDKETKKLTFEDCGSVVHNFLLLFGFDQHFQKHPEYYPYINGQRTSIGLEEKNPHRVPCLTNEGVYQIILKGLRKRIEQTPNTKIWNVSLPDGINGSNDYCNCSICKNKYESGNGELSETFFPFINRLAYDLPNYVIRTLAYTVTSRPHQSISKLSNGLNLKSGEIAKNVEIIFTLPDNDKSKSIIFAQDEKSLLYKENLKKWKSVTYNIFIWEYIVNYNYYLFPFPTLHTIKDNFQYFKENNVKSIFIQSSSMEVSALGELNSFVYSQLMWDSSKDLFVLIRKFCADFYGTASGEMYKYIISLLNYIKLNKEPIWNPMGGIGSLVFHVNPEKNRENTVLFSIKHLKEFKSLLNSALKKTKNSIYYDRILKEYLCILFVEIEASTFYANKKGGKFNQEFYTYVTNNGKFDFYQIFAEFLSLCKKLKIDYISESLRTPLSYIADVKTSMHLN